MYVGLALLSVTDGQASGDGQLAGGLFGMIAAVAVGMAVRERLEITATDLRVVRLWTCEVVARDRLAAMVRTGGRGRPRYLALAEGMTTTVRGIDLRSWPPKTTREADALRVPGLMPSRRIARALDLPYTTSDGRPLPCVPPSDLASLALTPSGHLRPYAWVVGVVVALLVGLTISAILFWPSQPAP